MNQMLYFSPARIIEKKTQDTISGSSNVRKQQANLTYIIVSFVLRGT